MSIVKEPPPAFGSKRDVRVEPSLSVRGNKSSTVDGYEYDVCGCDGARERSINTDMYAGYIAHTT